MSVIDDSGFLVKSYEWGDSTDNICGGAVLSEKSLYISGNRAGSKVNQYSGTNNDFVLYKFDFN